MLFTVRSFQRWTTPCIKLLIKNQHLQEGERSNEIEELEEMVKKKFKQSKNDVKAMEKRMDNIEKLLQTIVNANTTPRNEQAPDEDADDEDFGDMAWW